MDVRVSFGEAADKITILQIKKRKIQNEEQLQFIEKELCLLRESYGEKLEYIKQDLSALTHINELLWNIEDVLRNFELHNKFVSVEFIQAAREVYFLNDRRAYIKRKIDIVLGSPLREIKSYAPYHKPPILVLPHMGTGDQIILNGMIRYLALFHESVLLVANRKQALTIEFMYRDIADKVKFLYVDRDEDISPVYGADLGIMNSYSNKGYIILPLGNHRCDIKWLEGETDFAEAFYKQANVPYEVRWRYFFVARDEEREERMYRAGISAMKTANYAFIHDDPTRQMTIRRDHDSISSELVLYHPNSSDTNPICGQPDVIFDYCKLIENAEELHMMDSSFAIMADCVCNLGTKKRVLHAYAKGGEEYRKLYKTEWKFV